MQVRIVNRDEHQIRNFSFLCQLCYQLEQSFRGSLASRLLQHSHIVNQKAVGPQGNTEQKSIEFRNVVHEPWVNEGVAQDGAILGQSEATLGKQPELFRENVATFRQVGVDH